MELHGSFRDPGGYRIDTQAVSMLIKQSCHSYVLRMVEGLSHRQKKPWAPATSGLKEWVNSSSMSMLTDSSL